jgi:tetratricopeptide (TPR) repeat protein
MVRPALSQFMKRTPPKAQAQRAPLTAAISLAPGRPPGQMSVAQALGHGREALAAGDFDSPAHIAEQLRRIPGLMREGLVLLLQTMVGLTRPGDALILAERLLAIGVESPTDVLAVAQGLQLASRHERAIELLTTALGRTPRNLALLHYRAELFGEIGEHGKATAELRAIIAQEPQFFAAYRSLAMIDELTDAEVAFLENATIPASGRIAAWSALAFAWRRRKDPQREFHYLDRAQALLAEKDPWIPAEETEMADQAIAMLDRAYFETRPAAPVTGTRRPIFIVGMPRSGSTLAEQILVSAEGVEAAGESALFPWLLLDLARRRYGLAPYPEIALRLTSADLLRLRDDYLDLVDRVYTRASVFVDKQFTNWKYLGLIRQILPEALFVHTIRDPLDTCLSTYQQAFAVLGYGHSLEHLALFHRDQDRVMAHWKALFPERIHTLEYERLVADPGKEIRALLSFCGIPWTERALRFHETRRGIRTASVMQVRRPIYHSSVRKWRAYEKQVEPARRVLQGC